MADYCLLCHEKISRWRRMKTGSDFCCDEHMNKHRGEMLGRLMEYEEPSHSHHAEDPIHRLAQFTGHAPELEQHPWPTQPFVAVELRRQMPDDSPAWMLMDGILAPVPILTPTDAMLAPWETSPDLTLSPAFLPALAGREIPASWLKADHTASWSRAVEMSLLSPQPRFVTFEVPTQPTPEPLYGRLADALLVWPAMATSQFLRLYRLDTQLAAPLSTPAQLRWTSGQHLRPHLGAIAQAGPLTPFAIAARPAPAVSICGSAEVSCVTPTLYRGASAAGMIPFYGWRKETPSFLQAVPAHRQECGLAPHVPLAWLAIPNLTVSLPAAPRPTQHLVTRACPGATGTPARPLLHETFAGWIQMVPARSDASKINAGAPSITTRRTSHPQPASEDMRTISIQATGASAGFQSCSLLPGSSTARAESSLPPHQPKGPVAEPRSRRHLDAARLTGLRLHADLSSIPQSPWYADAAVEGGAAIDLWRRAPLNPVPAGHGCAWRPLGELALRAAGSLQTAVLSGPARTTPVFDAPPLPALRKPDLSIATVIPTLHLTVRELARIPTASRLSMAQTAQQAGILSAAPADSPRLGPFADRPLAPLRFSPATGLRWIRPGHQEAAGSTAALLVPRDCVAPVLPPCGVQAPHGALHCPVRSFAWVRHGKWEAAGLTSELLSAQPRPAATLPPCDARQLRASMVWPALAESLVQPVAVKSAAPIVAPLAEEAPKAAEPPPVPAPPPAAARPPVLRPPVVADSPFVVAAKPRTIAPPPAPDVVVLRPVSTLPVPPPVSEHRPAEEPLFPLPAPAAPVRAHVGPTSLDTALYQARVERRSSAARRLARLGVHLWEEFLQANLAKKPVRVGLATITILMILVALLRNPGNPLGAAAQSAGAAMAKRSYYLQEENFSGALGSWTDSSMFERQPDGSVETREGLSLFRPSLSRIDYELNFTGWLRQGSLGWVVRASDDKNYYAFKLQRKGRGKERRSFLIRYAVIDGVPNAHEKNQPLALPVELEESRPYQITVQLSGNQVTTLIDQRGVDSYTDSRLRAGGVGFFSEKGEATRIHSMSLSGNPDTTGRLIYWLRGFYQFLFE